MIHIHRQRVARVRAHDGAVVGPVEEGEARVRRCGGRGIRADGIRAIARRCAGTHWQHGGVEQARGRRRSARGGHGERVVLRHIGIHAITRGHFELEAAAGRRCAVEHACDLIKSHARRQCALLHGRERQRTLHHHRAGGVGGVDLALAHVIDEPHRCLDIHRGHLRSREIAHDLIRSHVLRHRHPFTADHVMIVGAHAGAVNAIGIDRVCHRLAALAIERAVVLVEFVAARHHLIAIRQILRCGDQLIIHTAARDVALLKNAPFHLDLVGFAIGPVFVIEISGIIAHQFAEFDLLVVVRRRFDFLHPHGLAKFLHGRHGRHRRHDHGLHLRGRGGHGRDVGEGR